MKFICLVLGLLCFFARADILPNYCSAPLELVYSEHWYPYFYVQNNTKKGIDLDILRKITDSMGCQVKLVYMPIKRAHKNIVVNRNLIMTAATINKARLKYARFSKPYRDELSSIFYLQNKTFTDDIKLERLVDKSQIIAINNPAWYGNMIEMLRSGHHAKKFVHISSMQKRVDMMRRGRAQAIVEDHIAACSYFYQHALDITPRLRYISVNKVNVSFMFSKLAPVEFTELFDKTLTSQIEQGVFDEILSQHTPIGC